MSLKYSTRRHLESLEQKLDYLIAVTKVPAHAAALPKTVRHRVSPMVWKMLLPDVMAGGRPMHYSVIRHALEQRRKFPDNAMKDSSFRQALRRLVEEGFLHREREAFFALPARSARHG